MRRYLIKMLFVAPLALGLAACEDDPLVSVSDPLLGVTQGATGAQSLVAFNRQTPGTLTLNTPITGGVVTNSDVIIGLDVRPADGTLIALGRNGTAGRLYSINPSTGVSTLLCALVTGPMGSSVAVALGAADNYGVDFNPTALAGNALRVVSSAGQNLRIETRPGMAIGTNVAVAGQCATATDTALNTSTAGVAAARNGISAAAYTNSVSGATSTTLYYIDSTADRLTISTDPNGGLVGNVGGTLGVDISGINGFEIGGTSGAVTLVAQVGAATVSTVYNVNLATGVATELGTVGGTALIAGVTTRP